MNNAECGFNSDKSLNGLKALWEKAALRIKTESAKKWLKI